MLCYLNANKTPAKRITLLVLFKMKHIINLFLYLFTVTFMFVIIVKVIVKLFPLVDIIMQLCQDPE